METVINGILNLIKTLAKLPSMVECNSSEYRRTKQLKPLVVMSDQKNMFLVTEPKQNFPVVAAFNNGFRIR